MTNSCGNCKYGECREGYLYPYRCKKEEAVSYSEEKWMDRVHRGYICEKWKSKEAIEMTREEAIDVLKCNYPSTCFESLCEAVEIAIQALSAQPRKKGRWYDVGSLSCRCSNCGCKSQKESLFCPNCGARMDGGKAEYGDGEIYCGAEMGGKNGMER